jgi:hypothetical protein
MKKPEQLRELVRKAEAVLEAARSAEANFGLDNGLGTRLHIVATTGSQLVRAALGVRLSEAEQSMLPQPKAFARAKRVLRYPPKRNSSEA